MNKDINQEVIESERQKLEEIQSRLEEIKRDKAELEKILESICISKNITEIESKKKLNIVIKKIKENDKKVLKAFKEDLRSS